MNRSKVRPARYQYCDTTASVYMNDREGGVRTQGGDLSDETTDELLKKITDLKVTNQKN